MRYRIHRRSAPRMFPIETDTVSDGSLENSLSSAEKGILVVRAGGKKVYMFFDDISYIEEFEDED